METATERLNTAQQQMIQRINQKGILHLELDRTPHPYLIAVREDADNSEEVLIDIYDLHEWADDQGYTEWTHDEYHPAEPDGHRQTSGKMDADDYSDIHGNRSLAQEVLEYINENFINAETEK